jgi:monoamine oxidase
MVGGSYFLSCKKEDPGPEIPFDGTVAVIGGGLAGLCAADVLNAKGINVVVLEATKQLGGRIRSLKNQQTVQSIADFPVELGADYFQGSNSPWGVAVGNMKLDTVDLSASRNHFIMDSQSKDAEGWQDDADFLASQQFVQGIKNYTGAPGSVADASANIADRAKPLLNGQVGTFHGSNNENVGITGLSEQMKLVQHTEEFRTMKHNSLQDVVISRFNQVIPKVRFEVPVKSIRYGGELVIITLENGETVEANYVIVAVPVTILKSGITFTPQLPESKRNALNRIGMDPCMRVVLDFKKNFWGEDSRFIWGGISAPQIFNAGFGRSEFYRTMSITICGPKALELSAKPEVDVVNEILAELDVIYNGQASLFIRKEILDGQEGEMIYFVQDWTKDPYFKGGFSYPTVTGTNGDRLALAASTGGNLFFAGEATDGNGDAGTINGALSSAARVTTEVINKILGIS